MLLALLLTGTAKPPDKLDPSHDILVFSEDFHDLNVSARGPGTKWIAHTPWGGDFGDAAFTNPQPGFPFCRHDGHFAIMLRKQPNGRWQSGLLASVDPAGHGFAQQFGYFEMRAKLPPGPGVWPAFWLDSMPPKGSGDPSVEIDVLEQYGKFPAAFNSTVTVWGKAVGAANRSQQRINTVPAGSLSAAFHRYGVSVDPAWIVFSLDGNEYWRVRTPAEHRHGLAILVDLGLGSGWPIEGTINPSYLQIDYVRAYAGRPG